MYSMLLNPGGIGTGCSGRNARGISTDNDKNHNDHTTSNHGMNTNDNSTIETHITIIDGSNGSDVLSVRSDSVRGDARLAETRLAQNSLIYLTLP